MALAKTLRDYLEQKHVAYRTLTRTGPARAPPPGSSADERRVVRSVLLRDEEGYTLAILPADHRLCLDKVERAVGSSVHIASELEIAEIFTDCDAKSLPAVGGAYGVDVVVENRLAGQEKVYFAGGDSRTVIQVSGDTFRALIEEASWADFAERR